MKWWFFFKISPKLSLKFLKVSSKLEGHPEIWGSDIQPQLRQRFYQWLAGGLSIWRLCRVVRWNVATSMSVRSGRSWGKCLKVFLWSSFNQLPCRKVCYPAICCNSCWDHFLQYHMRGFQLTVIWYKATVLHVNINLFWFLLLCHGPICCFHFWFPFHALHRHLVSVYIIDQETHCICNNSHSTFPFHLSWMFLSTCIRLGLYWLCMPGERYLYTYLFIYIYKYISILDPPLEWMTR